MPQKKEIPHTGGITETREYNRCTIEYSTDCHGDYTKIRVKLHRNTIREIMPEFRQFGIIKDYLPGLYKLDKQSHFTILFSDKQNEIYVTLRKNIRPAIIKIVEEILTRQEKR